MRDNSKNRGGEIIIVIASLLVIFIAIFLLNYLGFFQQGSIHSNAVNSKTSLNKVANLSLTEDRNTEDTIKMISSTGGGGGGGGATMQALGAGTLASDLPYMNTPSGLPYILLYHGIVTTTPTAIEDIPLSDFTTQMQWLHDNGYHTVTLKDYFLVYNKQLSDKDVILIFDDGYTNFMTNAMPVLQMYNFTATIGVVTSWVGTFGYMPWSDISYCYSHGMEIASHSVNHESLLDMSYSEIVSEINGSRNSIQSHSIPVYSFIYPYGLTNSTIDDIVKNSGYIDAREVGGLSYAILPPSHICSGTDYTVCSSQIQNNLQFDNFVEIQYRQEFGETWESMANAVAGIRNFNSGTDDLEFTDVPGYVKQSFYTPSSGIYKIVFRVKTGSVAEPTLIESAYTYTIDGVKYSVPLGNVVTGGPFVDDLWDSAWGFQNTSDINLAVGNHELTVNTSGSWEVLDYFIVQKRAQCAVDNDCNDTLFCNGEEKCSSGICGAGTPPVVDDSLFCTSDSCDEASDIVTHTPISCVANDLLEINTCTNIPDDNPLTLDFRNPFTSTCDETNDVCTTGSETISHTCNVTTCGAQCDTIHSCAATECNNLDTCVGKNYYDYSNVSNSCQAGCTCETNACGAPVIITNDPRCRECENDSGCSSLTRNYCSGDLIQHDEGRCVNYVCIAETTTTQNCNDGLFCNGAETCNAAACVSGTAINCAANNILGINTCTNNPDNNPLTLDLRGAFTSICNEVSDSCTTGEQEISHTCNKNTCGAQCDPTHACPITECDNQNGCVGNDYYAYANINNACLAGCTCETNACGAPVITVNAASCMPKVCETVCNLGKCYTYCA
jgi:peptidoglycan/xylan/chitin deacetylase (PgdA/CDA1 family)